ncbi:MAG: hypothetical protein PHO37_03800 [Kiritimatiellae bacterium]|nr:hypothetical protein [Kiritimatiellia bacterium]
MQRTGRQPNLSPIECRIHPQLSAVLSEQKPCPAAPAAGAFDGDADGDGLTLFEESYLFGTDPEVKDSDQDELSDGVETEAAFLTLWSGKDPAGKLYMDCHALQVTASDSARAALLKDGTGLIFTGDGASLQSYAFARRLLSEKPDLKPK